MSREGGPTGGGRRDGTSSSKVAAQPFPPQFYPVVGYQGSPHAWFPPHPSTGVPGQWSPQWRPSMGYPTPTPPWSDQQVPSTTTVTTAPSDEYTVDTLRRIYKDDDGRVEIQRVKVQRRHPETGAVALTGPEAMSVVPVGSIPQNVRRPPPRKHRRKPEIHVTAMGPAGPYPWYPYMPYLPYPYPYPYYLAGCMWPPAAPSDSVSTWSGNEGSEAVSSQQDSALNSQRLESRASRDSLSSALHRSSSPAAASHITDTHSIAPSDSVSVRGRKRETSLERALRGPTPPPRTKSRASSSLGGKSDDAGKTQEWMLEMQRALRTRGEAAVKVHDKGPAFRSDSTEVYKKIPPIRKRRKMKADDMSDKSSMTDLSERQSVVSDGMFDDSSRLSSELNYAFRKLERSVDAFKNGIAADPSPLQSQAASPSVDISHSSGDITPVESHATPLPLSDIRGLAEKAKEEEIKRREEYSRPRAISESICSLPSLESARLGSAPDVSSRPKLTASSSSQLTSSAETSTLTATPNSLCPSPAAASMTSTTHAHAPSPKTGSIEIMEVTSTTEDVLEAPGKPSISTEATEVSHTTVIHPPKSPIIACQPSSRPHSSQGRPPPPPPPTVATIEVTTKVTEAGITKVPAEQDLPSPVQLTGTPPQKSTDASTTVPSAATAPTASEGVGEASGRHSQASTATTFFSTRTADDSHAHDTDSTDIPLPTTDSADENEDSPASPGPEDDHLWVLQRPEEAPTLNTAGQDERRNAWRAEVSLWRARLVVSLCRGRGLDRQDWATLHLMVHHPLTLDLKLSLLHAPRLCAANSNMGPAVLRVALIQLAQYGEVLLQPEASRQPGWRSVRLDAAQAWTPVKGATEILQSLGYQERRGGTELRYRRRNSPEASVVARVTLDMLVLAEEFRLFLTGTHQYPNNVSTLFFPESLATGATPDLSQRPPSSTEGSFVSAQSEAVPGVRPQSEASSVTDDDTETLQTCTVDTKRLAQLSRNKSTSEEDVTLREDDIKKPAAETASAEIEERKTDTTVHTTSGTDAKTPSESSEKQHLPEQAKDATTINPDATSFPDLKPSSTVLPEIQRPSVSEVSRDNQTTTPAATPTVAIPETDSSSKEDGVNPVTSPTTTPAAPNDNPEEHVYEEIDVIRAQVQAIRASSVPTESAPPPLPPKKKISSGGEDDSGLSLTYPHVEWSTASSPGSLRGGSTGARRKKRRAPMPPEFFPPNWKENQEAPKKEDVEATAKMQESKEPDAAAKAEYRRSLNPFYEELDNLEDKAQETEDNKESKPDNKIVNGNPFYEDTVKAKGYIGKNPFYDDVEMIKKSDEYNGMKANQSSTETPIGDVTPASDVQSDAPAVRPKRRAPRPPPTPESHSKHTISRTEDSTLPQQGEGKVVAVNVVQADEGRKESNGNNENDSVDQPCKQTSQDNITALSASSDSLKNSSEAKIQAGLEAKPPLNKDVKANAVQNNSSLTPTDDHQGTEATRVTTPKQTRATRTSLSHPTTPPPPPPPTSPRSTNISSTENLAKAPREDSPPPIPPPKAPLSLLDEIPYMDANEVKEARAQREALDSTHDAVISSSPAATLKLSPTTSRQLSLTLALANDGLPPQCPPPPPPCPPPDSPPETPHTSPPETPHVSPPETPHTSPPETPHASPPATPRLTPKSSPVPPPRHQLQDSLVTAEEKADEDEAPPVPPKITPLESLDEDPPTKPPLPPVPPKVPRQEEKPHSPKASSAVHSPATETNSVQSSTSEERYEIPDTSRAPPPRPPVPMPPKTQKEQVNGKKPTPPAEYDRYEVPEAPKDPVSGTLKEGGKATKSPETEERYEIPEVVKDQPLKRGVNGVPCSVALGRTSSPRRGEIVAVFGPPKPPRRRRNNHSPPPRPPKHPGLMDTTRPDGLREPPPRSSSTTSSLTSSSSGLPQNSLQDKKTPKRRSWPFLLCDCLYVNNCRTYEDADK